MNEALPPFLTRAAAAIITVGEGRGFVAQLRGGKAIITAAHCLPFLPPPHPASYTEERTYRDLLGPLGSQPSIWAECAFVDLLADLAVLVGPDQQELFEQAEAYDELLAQRAALRIGRVDAASAVWLHGLDGQWHHAQARRQGAFYAFGETLALEGCPEAAYDGGTSGSPMVTADGRAVALVSVGEDLNPILADGLPRRLVARARR